MFSPAPGSVSFPKLEEETLAFWREGKIYEKSLAQREGADPFVFYEGPPTANGMPHPGHCLTRAIKDLFPRYKTMRGYRCERKAGWDTHGLPVEVEVCKELGIHSKDEIEAYGIEPFIQKCQASVWRYMQEWERLTERLGFWVNLDDAYVTYHQSYVESVWWSLKNLFDRGLLYRGHKIVWWWAQGGTALSAGEVGQGYREVADPSVYVKMPLSGPNFGLANDRTRQLSLLVWTTTPWTLPSNHFVAVNPDIEYVTVVDKDSGEYFVAAKDLLEALSEKSKRELVVEKEFLGEALVNHGYFPPFENFGTPYSYPGKLGNSTDGRYPISPSWRVLPADFVTTDSGTGLVHIAPAFGEDDYDVLQKWRTELQASGDLQPPELINCVGPDGKFTDEAPEFVRGRWVKDCDKDIIRDLKERGLLFHQEQYLHDYPFCWRAEEDPLIQYPRESWFIRTTAFKDQMLANNAKINWLPEHIKEGRFGKFLESNVDWALSRERYWGTPLPIWECDACALQAAECGYEELKARKGATGFEVWEAAKAANPELPDDLRVHKPYIDAITFDCEKCDGTMHRVPEVIDCWYDSGAMPFAQWGYKQGAGSHPEGPRQGEAASLAAERFQSQFPADFISEAIDQTRGWFYSQLAISTMLWGEQGAGSKEHGVEVAYPHPFKNCIVLGLMLSEWYEDKTDPKKLYLTEDEAMVACGAKGFKQVVGKMSKSKRNYQEPSAIFDRYGADALRWYLFANQPPWTSIRYSEQAIKDSIPEFLLRLWNCYSFFVIYANIDEWKPAGSSSHPNPLSEGEGAKSEIDRWIISELHRTTATVVERMDAYDNFAACAAITEFVDALSNWYVRRTRDRFWMSDKQAPEKLDAYATLYECLLTTCKLIAPFVPFVAETMYRNLASAIEGQPESVHLCDYPKAGASLIDEDLSRRMAKVRLISSLGRRAREAATLKVRQPLAGVTVILADTTDQAWLEQHAGVIEDELNVKSVEYSDKPELYVEHQVLPNFKLLGPKLGKLLPRVKKWLGEQSGSDLLANIRDNGKIYLELDGQHIALTGEEVEVRITAKEGYAAANDKGVVVVLATELTPELVREGLARDLVRAIQDRRKEIGCEFTDRIAIGVVSDDAEVRTAIEQFRDYIVGETLADNVAASPVVGAEPVEVKLGDATANVYVTAI